MLADLGGWPVLLGQKWDTTDDVFVVDLLVKLVLEYNKFLIDQSVAQDDKDPDVNIIQVLIVLLMN